MNVSLQLNLIGSVMVAIIFREPETQNFKYNLQGSYRMFYVLPTFSQDPYIYFKALTGLLFIVAILVIVSRYIKRVYSIALSRRGRYLIVRGERLRHLVAQQGRMTQFYGVVPHNEESGVELSRNFMHKDKYSADLGALYEQRECCFCLENFDEGVDIVQLPCMHFFHQKCVDDWVRNSGPIRKCPICSRVLV
jgi:hypothetical protein